MSTPIPAGTAESDPESTGPIEPVDRIAEQPARQPAGVSLLDRRLPTSVRMLTGVVLVVANALALRYFARSWAVYGNEGFGGYRSCVPADWLSCV